MKKLITATLLFFSLLSTAQTSVSVYLPMRTYHWSRDIDFIESLHNTEGGNFGFIIIFRKKQADKIFTEKQYGMYRNSYGEASFIAQQGIGYAFKDFNLSMSAGLVTGYDKMYENGNMESLPGVLKNNGIAPSVMLTLSYSKYKWQPTVNISPSFINGGLIRKFN